MHYRWFIITTITVPLHAMQKEAGVSQNTPYTLEGRAQYLEGTIVRAPITGVNVALLPSGKCLSPVGVSLQEGEQELIACRKRILNQSLKGELMEACFNINFRELLTSWQSVPEHSREAALKFFGLPFSQLMRADFSNKKAWLCWAAIAKSVYQNSVSEDKQPYLNHVYKHFGFKEQSVVQDAWNQLKKDHKVKFLATRPELPRATQKKPAKILFYRVDQQ